MSGTVNLGSLGAGSGFRILGESDSDQAGVSVSSAGDINNDGYDDLMIGSAGNGNNAGAAYVVYGAAGLSGRPRAEGHGRAETVGPGAG